MKNKTIFNLSLTAMFAVSIFLIAACGGGSGSSAEVDETKEETQTTVSFNVGEIMGEVATNKKASLATATSVKLSITTAADVVVVTDLIVDVLHLGGNVYITKPIKLAVVGNFKLTLFEVRDVSDTVIFNTPQVGDPEAAFVTTALPFAFSAAQDGITKVSPQVILNLGSIASDPFSFSTFNINEIGTFVFQVSAFQGNLLSETFDRPAANITIKDDGGNTLFTGTLDADETNIIQLPTGKATYTVTIVGIGASYDSGALNEATMMSYSATPLVALLQ